MGEFSRYPDQIDSSTELPKATDNVTPVKAEVVNRLRDAILMIEAELGIQPSGTYGTVRARLDAMELGSGGGFGTGLIEVLYNNVTVDNQVTDINFIGDVSVVLSAPHRVTVEVGRLSTQKQESITVTSPGQTSFTLTDTPAQSNAVEMFVNGVKQKYTTDYTVLGQSVSYLSSVSLLTSDSVEFWYLVTVPTIIDDPDSGGGASTFTVTSIQTSIYTAEVNDLVRCDPSGGGFTVNLPSAVGLVGECILIKNVTNSLNSITIQADGVETIDGSNTQILSGIRASYYLVSDDTGWVII